MKDNEAQELRSYLAQLIELSNNPPYTSDPKVEDELSKLQAVMHSALEKLANELLRAVPSWATKTDDSRNKLYMAKTWHGLDPLALPKLCIKCGSESLMFVNQSLSMPPKVQGNVFVRGESLKMLRGRSVVGGAIDCAAWFGRKQGDEAGMDNNGRAPKPIGSTVRCTGDAGELGIPEELFGKTAVVCDQMDSPWDGQLVDFGAPAGRLYVDPIDLKLVTPSGAEASPARVIQRIERAEQLGLWVKGQSVHRDDGTSDGECCPDFSCCSAQLLADQSVREEFVSAYDRGDEQSVKAMLGAFSALMMQRIGGQMFGNKSGS